MGRLLSSVLLFVLVAAYGCDSSREDIPFFIKSLDVYVYNADTKKEFLAGRIETNYFDIKDALERSRVMAAAFASGLNMHNWSYVCCTVTTDSSCSTKVR